MKAAPGQQGWQSAAVGRRDGGWCRCNSNSNDCREEESPGRDKHRQEERGEKKTEREGGGEEAAGVKECKRERIKGREIDTGLSSMRQEQSDLLYRCACVSLWGCEVTVHLIKQK